MFDILGDEGVHRVAELLEGEVAHAGNVEEFVHLAEFGEAAGALGDAGGFVAGAFEFVVGLHGDGHQAHVVGDGLAQGDVAHALGVDEDFEAVNLVVEGDDLAGHGHIVGEEGLHGEADGINRALAHEDEVLAQVFEFVMKIAFHGERQNGRWKMEDE